MDSIAKALDHATRAASRIAAFLLGDAASLSNFARELRHEYATYRATRAAYYRLETRWSRSLYWERRREESA
jgi:hypothetical protein